MTNNIEKAWQEKVFALKIEAEKLGRFPKQNEHMGKFLSNQRQASKASNIGKWTSERKAFMDEHTPGWSGKSRDKVWETRVLQLKLEIEKLGRLPVNKEAMGHFLTTQQQVAKGNTLGRWTPEREAFMDNHIPGWKKSDDKVWQNRVLELSETARNLERMPLLKEPMGQFLITQQQASRGQNKGIWNAEREAFMDEHVPGWKVSYAVDESWKKRVLQLKEIVDKLGRMPKFNEEMGQFLRIQRHASKNNGANRWTPEREALMDKHIPGWQGEDPEKVWKKKVLQLKLEIDRLGHFPTSGGKYYNFLWTQRSAKSGSGNGRWTPEREAFMDKHIPGWND